MSCTSKYPKGICPLSEHPQVAVDGQFYPIGTVIGMGGKTCVTSYAKIMGTLHGSTLEYYDKQKNDAKNYRFNIRCEGLSCLQNGGFMRVNEGVVCKMKQCTCPLKTSRFESREALMDFTFLSTVPDPTDDPKKRRRQVTGQVRKEALQEAIIYLVDKEKKPIVYRLDGNFKYSEQQQPVYRSKNGQGDYYYDLGLWDGSLMQIRIKVTEQTQWSKSFFWNHNSSMDILPNLTYSFVCSV